MDNNSNISETFTGIIKNVWKILFGLLLIIQIIMYGLCLYMAVAWITGGLPENPGTTDAINLIPMALIFMGGILMIPAIFIVNIVAFVMLVIGKLNNVGFFGSLTLITISTAYGIFMWLYIGPAFYMSDVGASLLQYQNDIYNNLRVLFD